MKKNKIYYTSIIVIIALAFSWLAGCTAQNKRVEQKLDFMIPGEPASLDPAVGNETYANAILHHLFEPLVKEDAEGEIVAAAAKRWETDTDQKVYTFYLREDAKWSDGQPVTSQDFKDAWMRIIEPGSTSAIRGLLTPYILNAEAYNSELVDASAVGIDASSRFVLKVRLQTPTPFFLEILTFARLAPIRKDIVDVHTEDWTLEPSTYISNGPFRMENYEQSNLILLSKNEHYWANDNVKLDQIQIMFRDRSNDIAKMYENNEIDIMYEITLADLRRIPSSEPDSYWNIAASTAFLVLNHEKMPMQDSRFRKALHHALDRKHIVDKSLLGSGIPSQYLVPMVYRMNGEPFHDFLDLDPGTDLDKASLLLKELEDDGLMTSDPIRFMYMEGRDDEKVSLEIAGAWSNIGLNVETIGMAWPDLYNSGINREYDVLMIGWTADYPHPMTFLETFKSGSINSVITGWSDPLYDEGLRDLLSLQDEEKSLQKMKQLELLITREHHIIPVYYRKGLFLVSPEVKGWYRNTSAQFVFTEAWIEE